MIPTALNSSNNTTQTVGSATIGIASLILEGRALSDDDYVIPLNAKKHVLLMPPGYNSTTMQQNHVPLINITTNPSAELPLSTNLAVTLKTAAALEAAVTAVVASNSRSLHQLRSKSPLSVKRPSLSSTTSVASSTSSSSVLSTNSAILIPSDSSVQHFQRIKQKLTQLRQSSPRATRDPFLAIDQKIIVGGPSSLNRNSTVDSPDLSADNSSSGDDVDNDMSSILPRNTQWKPSGGASCSWKSTPNFCNNGIETNVISGSSCFNRGDFSGSNSNVEGSNCNNKRVSTFNNSGLTTINSHISDNNLLHTLQSLASNCLWTSPRSMGKTTEDWDCNAVNPNGNDETRIDLDSSVDNNYFINDLNNGVKSSTMTNNLNSKINIKSNNINSKENDKIKANPQQGPHCDQFLKKIGLNGNKGQLTEFEEHICDMANLNEICFHWQMHCRQLEVMLSRSDPICIEVYLGPENDEILMEQWIIEKTDSPSTPSMTLQALCNAIRSQLYFSQITAWSDSIKKCNPFDKEIMENARIKSFSRFGIGSVSPSSLGLATSASASSNWPTIKKPRLNIFYRIKPYDSTASFNAKPNIHNFPNVLISGNCAISVCLKSLPRLQGGIPKINETNKMIKTLTPTTKNISGVTPSNCCILVDNNENCDILKPQSIVSSTSKTSTQDSFMFLNDSLNIPCTEKGKHKCDYDEEDGGSSDAVGDGGGNSSSGGSAENGDLETTINLSHREKQLMKYRKRMMKRDKKKKSTIYSNNASIEVDANNTYSLNATQKNDTKKDFKDTELKFSRDLLPLPVKKVFANKIDNRKLLDGKAQIDEIHILQQQQEFGSINSIGLPLYRTIANTVAESVQTQQIEMVSIGTQTSNIFEIPSCDKCNAKMTLVCLQCNNSRGKKSLPHLAISQNNVKKEKLPEKHLEKGELLLQAIQRVPKTKSQAVRSNKLSFNSSYHDSSLNNSCNTISLASNFQKRKIEKSPHMYCKQKNYQKKYLNFLNDSTSSLLKICPNNELSQEIFCHQQNFTSTPKVDSQNNCNCLPTCLTVQMEDFEVGNAGTSTPSVLLTPPLSMEMKNLSCRNEFDTPMKNVESKKISDQQKKQRSEIEKPTNLLQISYEAKCGKTKAKTNSPVSSTVTCTSLPIPIVQQLELTKSPNPIKSDISLNNTTKIPEVPVQKSNSAPTLPNSPSLSPRFIKQAAIYKRRSRHLSDRSDRSSLGSDDLTDEELDSLYPSPTSSPLKNKFFTKLSAFARRPLLGNLEENLFQKRFTPKMNVAGFKVLLGASGQFCPTQLTIPAASYFYELQGESLSTPYVCEIRLSRKGYTIPRVGTIQATLLNPFGTVVRMFVIPYDFHDMPPMNQTFIRQRILAVDSDVLTVDQSKNVNSIKENNSNNNNKKCGVPHCSKEYLHSLRYSIHLRFQTSRSGRLALHTDIRFLISRRTDCDTAAAHAKGALESPNELRIVTITPDKPKYSARQEPQNSNKI
ncbi:protein Atossa [Condylostylus longicornis]|uniref:protein Atossa n=1 Tax=Condylostylus longicornis TaxID=2530218 RepID=UPI00244DD836|nr:protein Atossa [Condylostylus longicornis]